MKIELAVREDRKKGSLPEKADARVVKHFARASLSCASPTLSTLVFRILYTCRAQRTTVYTTLNTTRYARERRFTTLSDVELARVKTSSSLTRIVQTPVSIYRSGPHYSHEFNRGDISISDVRVNTMRDVQKRGRINSTFIRKRRGDVSKGTDGGWR